MNNTFFKNLKHIYSSIKARILTHDPKFQPDQWVWGLNTIYTTTHIHIPNFHTQDRSKEKNKIERKRACCIEARLLPTIIFQTV